MLEISKNPLARSVVEIVLWVFTALWILPIVQMIWSSLQGGGFSNYMETLKNPMFPRFFLNSIIVAVIMIAFSMTFVALAGFAFSKLHFAGKQVLYYMMVAGLMLPVSSLVVPLFQTVKNLHLLNSYIGLVGPEIAFFLPFGLMMVKSYFDTIPNELMEAATIDGANSFQTFLRIITPLARPALVTAGVFAFLATWNEYLMPLLFMTNTNMQTITLAPSFFQQAHGTETHKLYASLVLISLPTIIFYMLTQRYLQAGMGEGAVK